MRKNIWITGSARGLGLEIAKQCANENINIFFGSRYEAEKYIKKSYFSEDFIKKENVHYIQCDISKKESVEKAYEQILEKVDYLDVLINNAGIIEYSSVSKIPEEQLDNLFRTNLYGSIFTSQVAIKGMKNMRRGAIINIISVTANTTFQNIGVYSATKAAQSAIFKTMREELRTENIKVINVYPAAMNTEIWDTKLRETKGIYMLSEKNTAKSIMKLVELTSAGELVTEEVTLRSIVGDF